MKAGQWVIAVLGVAAAALTLVAPLGPFDSRSDEQKAVDALRPRGDIEQITGNFNGLLAQIRPAIADDDAWRVARAGVSSPCTEFNVPVDAESRTTDVWAVDGGISDQDWPAAVEAVKKYGWYLGFFDVTVVEDRPGGHEITVPGLYGAVLHLRSGADATIWVVSGCHERPTTPR